jgi:hypothetical protein
MRCLAMLVGCLVALSAAPAAAEGPEHVPSSAPRLDEKGAGPLRARPKLARRPVSREGMFAVDATGERFRVGFPLYERVALGAGLPVASAGEGMGWSSPMFDAELRLSLALGFDAEEVWWNMRHRIAHVQVWSTPDDTWRMEATVVDGWYLRHDAGSFIVIPIAEDLRIPAPFDIAVDYRLGRARLAHDSEGWGLERLDVVELAFMADFIRDPQYRKRLAIGPASWYHAVPGDVWRHELSPMSAGKVLAGWDQRDGLASVYGEAVCGGALVIEGSEEGSVWRTGCRGELRAEWTPLAISDAPLSIPLTARAEVPFGDDPARWSVVLGLRLGVSLD